MNLNLYCWCWWYVGRSIGNNAKNAEKKQAQPCKEVFKNLNKL